MAGRKPSPSATIDNKASRRTKDEINERSRIENMITPVEELIEKSNSRKKMRIPKSLSPIARREYKRIVDLFETAQLNLLTDLDKTSLETYCEAYSVYRQAQRIWSAASHATPEDKMEMKDFLKLTEVFDVMNKQAKIMNGLAEKLLLTPTGRAKIGTLAVKATKEKGNGVRKLLDFED